MPFLAADVDGAVVWPELSAETTRRIAGALRAVGGVVMDGDDDALGGLDPGWVRSLGHPIRVAILRRMLDGEVTTPVALAQELKLSLPVVGYHVRFLLEAKQLTLVRRSRRRGAVVHHYRLSDRDATHEAMRRLGLTGVADRPAAFRSSQAWERLRGALAVLRAAREEQGISRAELAHRLQISASQLACIERGETDPRFTVLLGMVQALGTTLEDVFTSAES